MALLIGVAGLVAWRRTRGGIPALSAVTAFVTVPAGHAVRRLSAPRHTVAELTAAAPPEPEPDCVHDPGDQIPRLDTDGCLVIGTRADGTAAVVDPAEAGGLALSGPGGDEVARALLVALTVRSPGWDVQVVIPRADLARLLGVDQADLACGAIPGLVVTATLAEALFHLRVETMRGHHLDDIAAAEADRPRLILLAAPDDAIHCPRSTLSNYGAGIGVILLGSVPHAASCRVDATGTVTGTTGQRFDGAQLCTLTATAARGQMYEWALTDRRLSPAELAGPEQPHPAAPGRATGAPDEQLATSAQRNADTRAPAVPWAPRTRLYVRVLGPTTIEVDGHPMNVRMRGDAWDLLAILGVFRDGITDEAIADHLWPTEPATRQHQHLTTAVKTLNKTLREAAGLGRDVRFAIKNQRRHLATALIDIDLWRVQDALAAAADHDRSQALRLAVEVAGGPLLPDDDHPWTQAYRYDFTRQIIDAAIRLADTETTTDADLALHHLNQIADHVDPLAEDIYRQAMSIQASLGRMDAAHRTFQTLTTRLAENGLEPAWETVDLHQHLRAKR